MKRIAKKVKTTNTTNPELHPGYAEEYWRLVAFFEDDPTIEVGECDSKNQSCKIYTADPVKAEYLRAMIDTAFLDVEVICDEEDVEPSEEILAYICKDNPHFSCLYNNKENAEDENAPMYKAAMFKPDCMHYFSDDMFSPSGHTAITARDLAKSIFYNHGINFQTDFIR